MVDCLAHIRDVDRSQLSKGRAWVDPSCTEKIRCVQAGVPAGLNSPSGNGSLNYAFAIERNASGREFAERLSQDKFILSFRENCALSCKNSVDPAEDNFVQDSTTVCPALFALLLYERSQNRYVR